MKKYLPACIAGFLSAYSVTVSFHAPFLKEQFAETPDYITSSVYEILGSYNFLFLFVWIFCALILALLLKKGYSPLPMWKKGETKKKLPFFLLSVLFAFTLTIGIFYNQVATTGLFGSFVNYVKALLVIAGFTLLFYPSLSFLGELYENASFTTDKTSFFGKKTFLKFFLVLFLFYFPFLILSFPGNLCYDVIGQIEQVFTGTYSEHHPLLHTLIVGGFIKAGEKVLSSAEAGLFLYVLFQTVLLLVSFSACLTVLAKRKAKPVVLIALLCIFCLTPIYTNLATTAIKDIPYTAFVLLYLMAYAQGITRPEYLEKPLFHVCFAALQFGAICMRNNGLPLVVLSGIGAVIYLAIKKNKVTVMLRAAGAFFAESLVVSLIFLSVLGNVLHAESTEKGEMLSLPFQQTAYYLIDRGETVPVNEIAAIERVLGNADIICDSYNPEIADPVKGLYRKDATTKDLISYGKVYVAAGIRHPFLYTKAFLIHTYGWYSPAVANEIRYESDYSRIKTGLLFSGSDKVMVFLYRFANRFTPLGILENIGAAVWLLAFLTLVLIKIKKAEWMISLPLWVSFLICLASPCFKGHPRYALPILCGVVFLFVYAKTNPSGTER